MQQHTTFNQARIDTAAWRRWVESAVGAHLVAQAEDEDFKVYYWREREQEVDFIVDRGGRLTALEVKSGRRGMNSGLPAFSKRFHPERALVVGTGGVSLQDFFTAKLTDVLA